MSEEKEFLIIRIIITIVTSIIAIMLFALINCVIVNAENIPIDIISLSGGTSGECSGSYQYVITSCNGNYKKVWARFYDSQGILFANTTHNFEVSMQVWGVTTTGIPNISKRIFVYNGNTYIQATPDRNESFTIRPIEGNYTRFGAIWTFELDSTINSQFITIEFDIIGGSFSTLRDYNLEIIYPTDDGTRQVIGAISDQTNNINQNNNNNTNRIMNWAENFEQNWETNFNEKFNSEGNFEDSQETTYYSSLEELNQKEGALKNKYENNGFIYQFFINQQANTLIWNLIDKLMNLSTKIYALIMSVLSLGIICQILRRNKL